MTKTNVQNVACIAREVDFEQRTGFCVKYVGTGERHIDARPFGRNARTSDIVQIFSVGVQTFVCRKEPYKVVYRRNGLPTVEKILGTNESADFQLHVVGDSYRRNQRFCLRSFLRLHS